MADEEKALERFSGYLDDRLSLKSSQDSKGIEDSLGLDIINSNSRGLSDKDANELFDAEKGAASRTPSLSRDGKPSSDESNLVDWDGDHDPENPMHFSLKRKIWMSCMASFLTFAVSFSSSVFSADTKVTAKEFHVSDEVMVLGVSLYVLGFACGPLVFGPISELYGRSKPLLIGFFCFCIMNIPVAVAQNLETILVCRFVSAAFGAAPVAIAPGILVDLWEPYPRGIATLLWATTVFAGPTIGPVVGEFTVADAGWRWTMWISFLLGIVLFFLSVFTISETFAPIILQRKAARLRLDTKNWALHSKRDEQPVQYGYLARKYGIRPLQMLVQEPILMAITAYMALVYAIIYLTFFAYPFSFEEVRGWKMGVGSLPFFGLLIGYLFGCLAAILESRLRFRRLLQKHNGEVAPEQRIPPMFAGTVAVVGGLFWFGWTSSPNITWVPQVIAGIAIGAGIFLVFMPGQVYLMDIYKSNAASALAGNAFVRAALACAFPLVAGPMYERLGVQWATSLLGFLCIALAPFPVVFYFYGKKVRSWSKFVLDDT